jgi:hypothetical protein
LFRKTAGAQIASIRHEPFGSDFIGLALRGEGMKPGPFEYQAPGTLRDAIDLLASDPEATDFPRIRAIALEHYPSPSNPLGVKGAGEGAIIPVGGLMANALASFGAMPNQLPLSPVRVCLLGPNNKSVGIP